MISYSLRDVLRNGRRTFASVVGVALGVGLFASIARLDVKSKVVATGATVLTTTVDFRPLVYSAGVSYQF